MKDAWDLLSSELKAPEGDSIIMRYDRYLNWDLLSGHYSFSVDLLRIYQHRVNWSILLGRNSFDENLLREMAPNFSTQKCWSIVCEKQKLSESFIHEFADKVDWENIALYQKVSGKFLLDHCKYYSPNN